MLNNNLLPYLDALIADGATDIIFQQDNAQPHVSKKSKRWLQQKLVEDRRILLMEWPPNSPDMNPIEHIWDHIKRELHKRYPDTNTLK